MAGIRHFEDIIAWQEARKLTKEIYSLTRTGLFAKDFSLQDQIQRASVPAMANIAEGFDCESNVDFARFLGIARRSVAEIQSLLYAALDIGYISEETFKKYMAQASKTKGLIGGFKLSVQKGDPA